MTFRCTKEVLIIIVIMIITLVAVAVVFVSGHAISGIICLIITDSDKSQKVEHGTEKMLCCRTCGIH